jgi:hypothetical protein
MAAAARGEAGSGAVRRLRAQALRMEGGSHGEAAVDGALFLDAGRLATRSADGRVCVWDFAGRRLLATWKARPPRAPPQHNECCIVRVRSWSLVAAPAVPGALQRRQRGASGIARGAGSA